MERFFWVQPCRESKRGSRRGCKCSRGETYFHLSHMPSLVHLEISWRVVIPGSIIQEWRGKSGSIYGILLACSIWSSQIWISCPFPGIQVRLALIKGLTVSKSLNIGEPVSTLTYKSTLLSLFPWKYLCHIACFHQVEFLVISRQSSLVTKVEFMRDGSLIPNSPWFLSLITWFHVTKRKFFLFVFPPCQRKDQILVAIWLLNFLGPKVQSFDRLEVLIE